MRLHLISLLQYLLSPGFILCLALFFIGLTGRWLPIFKQLLDPLGFSYGLISGIGVYLVSLALIYRRQIFTYETWQILQWSFRVNCIPITRLILLFIRAIYEESFWRGTLQFVLGNHLFSVILITILFTARHIYLAWINSRRLLPRLIIEFLLFSLLLGSIYASFERIQIVVGIHLSRNLLISAYNFSRLENSVNQLSGRDN